MKTNFHNQKINRGQSLIGITIVLIVVGVVTGGLYYYLQKQIPEIPKINEKVEEKPAEKPIIKKCTDDTPYGQCSINKPKYCDNGKLIDKCSICGCSSEQYCDEFSDTCKISEKVNMLIFISPQYANDFKIKQAISEYIDAVKKDIGWNTKIITLTPDINDFRKIDEIIEDYHFKLEGRLKACIMVGEDIDTALSAESEGQEYPSITPWATNDSYIMKRKNEKMECIEVEGKGFCKIIDNRTGKIIETLNIKDLKKYGRILKFGKVISEPKRIDVVISLLYPPHKLDYQTKSQLIYSAFKKFSKNRDKIYPKKSTVFLDPGSTEWAEIKKEIFQTFGKYNEMYYKETPSQEEVNNSLDKAYMLYYAGGHAFSNLIEVSPPPNTSTFYAKYLEKEECFMEIGCFPHPPLNTPIFLGSGCYTGGWWSNDLKGNDKLDYSINNDWFGAKIFTNPYLRVMVLGELTQDDAQRPRRNFIEMAIPDLMEGKTLAESLIGDTLVLSIDDAIIYGDPTFHYNFSGIKDKSKHIYYKELKNNLNIVDKFISWGYKMPPSNRSIDTIIIHSSYDALGTNPYSVEGVIYEYKIYGVTPHYLIDRNGTIFRLVKEENIAYHAGKSKMPDGRENVNNFSIGIELIYKKDEQPNEIQYISLCNLVKYLKSKYKIKYLLGHNHIAPDRKTDPWNFDWQKFNEMLKIRTL